MLSIPTPEQKDQCFTLCCWFTKLYLPVYIVRVDERTGNLFDSSLLGTIDRVDRSIKFLSEKEFTGFVPSLI